MTTLWQLGYNYLIKNGLLLCRPFLYLTIKRKAVVISEKIINYYYVAVVYSESK